MDIRMRRPSLLAMVPLPGIKEAKLLIKRLLSKDAIKTNYQVHLAFLSLGFLIW